MTLWRPGRPTPDNQCPKASSRTLRFDKAFADIPYRQELPESLTIADVGAFAAEHADHADHVTARWSSSGTE